MAIICREHGLLFIMVPRTGCTAVGEVLRARLGGECLPVADVLDSLVSLHVKKSLNYQRLLDDPASFVHRIPGYVEIPFINPAVERGREYWRCYTPRSRRIVEYVHQQDCRHYGYRPSC